METNQTGRGFLVGKFLDANGVACSIQESSVVSEEGHIWLGCDDIGLKKFTPYKGWEDISLEHNAPYGVTHIANTRMHLSQSQVADLLPTLAYFAEHGVMPWRTETAQQHEPSTDTKQNETGTIAGTESD